MSGRLAVISTPIGNLEDITLRALRLLREASLVAAEDTRRTRKLLTHYEISTPLVSVHAHNERQRARQILERLENGAVVALVSDAGTPGVSDPGAELVRLVLASGYRVEIVPGPSAVTAALARSGFPADVFTFLGFPPAKGRARDEWFDELASHTHTVVFFEAPHRLVRTLHDLGARLGSTGRVAVCRELTKLHEEFVEGSIDQIIAALGEPRGECTVLVSAPEAAQAQPFEPVSDHQLWQEFCQITESRRPRRAAISTLARRYGQSTRAMYQRLEQARAALK